MWANVFIPWGVIQNATGLAGNSKTLNTRLYVCTCTTVGRHTLAYKGMKQGVLTVVEPLAKVPLCCLQHKKVFSLIFESHYAQGMGIKHNGL